MGFISIKKAKQWWTQWASNKVINKGVTGNTFTHGNMFCSPHSIPPITPRPCHHHRGLTTFLAETGDVMVAMSIIFIQSMDQPRLWKKMYAVSVMSPTGSWRAPGPRSQREAEGCPQSHCSACYWHVIDNLSITGKAIYQSLGKLPCFITVISR